VIVVNRLVIQPGVIHNSLPERDAAFGKLVFEMEIVNNGVLGCGFLLFLGAACQRIDSLVLSRVADFRRRCSAGWVLEGTHRGIGEYQRGEDQSNMGLITTELLEKLRSHRCTFTYLPGSAVKKRIASLPNGPTFGNGW
jgi:hypothetical protein